MDFSQDWDVKEQEGLQEVEKLLEKTNEILEVKTFEFESHIVSHGLLNASGEQRRSVLSFIVVQEEENVLAIQAVLDSLMWTENDEFTLLDREDPLSEVRLFSSSSSSLENLQFLTGYFWSKKSALTD